MTAAKRPNDPIYYVYALLDTRKPGEFKYGRYTFPYEPFYVGKGKGHRVYSHNHRANVAVKNKIAAILKSVESGHKARIVKDAMTEDDAYELEMKVIARVGRKFEKTGPLLNYNGGGRGKQQNYVSEATRQRRAESLRAYWEKVRADKAAYQSRTKNMGRGEYPEHERIARSIKKKAFYATEEGKRAKEKISASIVEHASTLSRKAKKAIYTKAALTKLKNGSISRSKYH